MSLLKNKNNKIFLPENTLIFEKSNVKIITGVDPAQAEDDMIGDQVINPGDTVITTEGKQLVKNPNGSYTDLSTAGGGGGGSGANTTLSNLTAPTAINQDLVPANNLINVGSPGSRFQIVYGNQLNGNSALIASASITSGTLQTVSSGNQALINRGFLKQIEPTQDTLEDEGTGILITDVSLSSGQYQAISGLMYVMIEATVNYYITYRVSSVYDPASGWISSVNPEVSGSNGIPTYTIAINSGGGIVYSIEPGDIPGFTSITVKFRATTV